MRGIVSQARCINSRCLAAPHRAPVSAAAAKRVMAQSSQQPPVLLLDVMDTIVTDPFFEHMPRFFNLTFKELLAAKHPTAWVEFENAIITEDELFAKFFADGRQFDGQALIQHMVSLPYLRWLQLSAVDSWCARLCLAVSQSFTSASAGVC